MGASSVSSRYANLAPTSLIQLGWLVLLTATMGCFPSFDGLTGGATLNASTHDAEAAEICGERCQESPPAGCIDSALYPGGGIHKTDFADVSDMILNKAAKVTDGILQVSVDPQSSGSAFISAPFAFDARTSIYAHFRLRIGGGDGLNGSDGLAFILQNSAAGATAIGIGGGGLGYDGISPSVAVEFDTFYNPGNMGGDPDGNHVAILSGGNVAIHIAHANPAFQLKDGVIRDVWIDYDWSADQLEVYLGEGSKPDAPLLKHGGLSLLATLGDKVYMGFSSASGSMSNQHEIRGEAWFVTSARPKCR